MASKHEKRLNLITSNRTANLHHKLLVWKNKNKTDNKE